MTGRYLFVLPLIFFITVMGFAKINVGTHRQSMNQRLQVARIPLPSTLIEALAGEFKGVVANYLLMEAASFVGSNVEADEDDWFAVANLLEQSSVLDPYFQQTYILSQGVLPWFANKIEENFIILHRSREHRTWDWLPGFFIAFNHFYFYQDYVTASTTLMETSRMPGAPSGLATWAARLVSQTGQHQTAIEFLAGIYENTEDETQKEMLLKRMKALQGAYIIQKAVDKFQDTFERLPKSLEEVVAHDFIKEIPPNPYNRPYRLIEGVIEF